MMKYFNYVFLSFALSSSLAFASNNSDDVCCPQLSSIQNAASKLDSVGSFEGRTYAWTSTSAFSENGYAWGIATIVNRIKDPDEALRAAIAQVQGVDSLEDLIAEKLTVYVCYYGPKDVVALTTGHSGFRSEFLSVFRR